MCCRAQGHKTRVRSYEALKDHTEKLTDHLFSKYLVGGLTLVIEQLSQPVAEMDWRLLFPDENAGNQAGGLIPSIYVSISLMPMWLRNCNLTVFKC